MKAKFGFRESTELGPEFYEQRRKVEEGIPKVELQQRHIRKAKILLNRDELLAQMPKGGVVAEIGVNEGEFSERILEVSNPGKLHLIDAWGDPTRYTDELKERVRNKFRKSIDAGTVEVNVGFSTDILRDFRDAYFDWVYLDTDHTYQTTSAELNILKSKVKHGGIIAGHDYTVGNWVGDFRYGVIEAVHELCVKDDWEIVYLTTETHQCRNFAIRKLQ